MARRESDTQALVYLTGGSTSVNLEEGDGVIVPTSDGGIMVRISEDQSQKFQVADGSYVDVRCKDQYTEVASSKGRWLQVRSTSRVNKTSGVSGVNVDQLGRVVHKRAGR